MNACASAVSGNALASLLLGQVNAFTIDIQQHAIQPRAHIAEFFVGDDWKVSPRLTLNLGTRYTLNFPSTEKRDQGAIFNLKSQVLEFPHTARELECCDFGPRVGFAYQVTPKMVVRGGFGMFYGGEENQGGSPNRGEGVPFNETMILWMISGASFAWATSKRAKPRTAPCI